MRKLFGEGSDRKKIMISIVAVIITTFIFILVEFISGRAGLFKDDIALCLVDSVYRILFGIIATIILYSSCGRNWRDLYFGKIPGVIWLLLLPFYVYLISYVDVLSRFERVTFEFALSFAACSLQQITTGFFEETLYRGVAMSAFRAHYADRKWRLAAVFTSGVLFGLAHSFNFIFTGNVAGSMYQALMTTVWGMFMAAIYMISDNLLLVMALHAIWDIWIRIPGYFFDLTPGSTFLTNIGDDIRFIIHPIVLGIVAIYVCLSCTIQGLRTWQRW